MARQSRRSRTAGREEQGEVISVDLEKYAPQDPDPPLKEISFFHATFSVKGVTPKRLVLPAECVFWLQKADGYYLMTNIEKE